MVDPDLSPFESHPGSFPATPPVALRPSPLVLGAICLGGALGASARYGVTGVVHARANGFPWDTFSVNVVGSLAIGVIVVLILERFPPTLYLRPFVATGFLGAFTTYSTFAVGTDLLVEHGHPGVGLLYVAASLAAGLFATFVGMRIARSVGRPRGSGSQVGGTNETG